MTWSIRPILDEPEIALVDWAVFEVPLIGEIEPWTRHLVGYCNYLNAGQSSAAVVAFDPIRRVGLTKSGRVYKLDGAPGRHFLAQLVWNRWKLLSRVALEQDVTDEVLDLMVTWPVGCTS